LGFLRAGATESLRGVLPDDAVGHFGFTGTSLWIDPDRGLFVLLLTNRSYSQAGGARGTFTALKEVRGRVADAAARAFDAPPGPPRGH